jgi:Tol biopolymer transport system component
MPRPTILLSGAGILLFLACSDSSGPADPPPLAGRLVFASDRQDGTYLQLYVADADGGDPEWIRVGITRVVNSIDVAPDGERIAFTSADGDLWIVEADGAGLANLTNDTQNRNSPRWSPDGEWIAFSASDGLQRDIYRIRPDGSSLQPLTTDPADDYLPVWSPDGTMLAFTSNRDGTNHIYVMNADGSSPSKISTGTGLSIANDWSPDGLSLAIGSDRSGGPPDFPFPDSVGLFIMGLDGSIVRQLPGTQSPVPYARFTPDGSRLAFEQDVPNEDILIVNADGTNLQTLIQHPARDNSLAWGPAR